ncbi:MAG: ABC transporter ATP-binding protein [Verrucomicrobia bacterium]|nr:ABC transporter ATP-binding protein [Verrucomicrobiota bacterium]
MIVTKALTKRYADVLALDALDLVIEEGEIFGYIGPNGAGKSTTIRILSGLLRPTSGSASVADVDVVRHPQQAKRVVGYMPDTFGVYQGMRVWEYLDFFGAAYRLPRATRRGRIDEVLGVTGTDAMRDYFVDSLSRGMQQRVGIARALIHDPKVLFLDEPTSGLDPRARIEMRQLLKRLKERGKTILVSSHILPELASVCDRIGILEQARLLLCDRMEAVMRQVEQRRVIEVEVLGDPAAAAAVLVAQFAAPKLEVTETVGRLLRLSFEGQDEEISGLLACLLQQGVGVLWFREVPLDLEHIYMKVTAEAKAGKRRTNDGG